MGQGRSDGDAGDGPGRPPHAPARHFLRAPSQEGGRPRALCSVAGKDSCSRNLQLGRLEAACRAVPEATVLRGHPCSPACVHSRSARASVPRGRCCDQRLGSGLTARPRPRLGAWGPRHRGRETSQCPGSPGPPQSEAAKCPGPASSPRLAPWPPSGSIGRAGLEAASSHLPGELGPGQQRFPAASSLALSGMTSSGSHSGKELQSPWEWEWRGAFQGPSWQPPVPDQGRHHASGCLPAGRPLGGQLAFVSFSG